MIVFSASAQHCPIDGASAQRGLHGVKYAAYCATRSLFVAAVVVAVLFACLLDLACGPLCED